MRSGKRRRAVALTAMIIVAAGGFGLLGSDRRRAGTAQSILKLQYAWIQHWPWESGKYAVGILDPLLLKTGLVPARLEIEPGVSLLLDPRDLVDRMIMVTGEWQPTVWESLSTNIKEGSVFLDVGAHIGYYSMKSAPRVGPNGRVVAFEPNPNTLNLLRDNVRQNGFSNVIVEPVACTDHEQVLTLYEGPENNTGSTSLSRENAEGITRTEPKSFQVQGRRIDDVVRELHLLRVDAMKVDVEGAEYYVLKGALETLKRFHPKVTIELIPHQLAAMGTKVEDVTRVFQEAGYNTGKQIDVDDWEWTVSR